MTDVEELYPVSYVQGKSFTVHTPSRDIVSHKHDKIYLADFSSWVARNNELTKIALVEYYVAAWSVDCNDFP